ncbi:hypothetical protein COU16_00140 [Candidatus Kaiserbacteria bacterium CG10_big_fil_rev_8_21_14_0_10_47_16]|uniref:Uncharacterized protein n=1 Tax=Candidatus Kaiserbacteria bacterium CG10_big_fil_rev_8_21_14_0_10_47_16 TaxID=1974608 RepID=A0A2H0UGI6_9BACT|nr:MAG: hypothetical protein COU16_00140 [Candidatus Kaiserbacteria bacterium CG10_big_fil_rev_8_21_14_0_10_47_16]
MNKDTQKKIRVGILGTANIAKRYAVPAFQALPTVELVAIASRSETKAKEWADEYGLEPESYDTLIARNDIDIIYSPLPVGSQEEWVLKAAQAGKHIICEKSITHSFVSAKKMVEACRAAGVALYENFVPEFHPQHERVLSLIEEGRIGTPRVWNGAYGFPPFPADDIRNSAALMGGALNDCACYTVFMARKIMREEPLAVTCTLHNDGKEVDVRGSALLEFQESEALLSFGFDNLYQNRYSVWGSKGMVQTNRAFAVPPTMELSVELTTNDGAQDTHESFEIPATNQFALSFDFFTAAVAAGDITRFEEMYKRILRQAAVLEAMRISSRTGQRIEITEIMTE